MTKIKLNVKEEKEFSVVSFRTDEIIKAEDLISLSLPEVNGTKGVVISGRGPIWLYCFLAHFYHPTQFVATYDPRLGGAVIVQSHTVKYRAGSILKYCPDGVVA